MQPEPWAGEMSVPREAQCSFTARHQEIHNCCVMTAYRPGLDVDTAFARTIQEYGFSKQKPPGEGAGYPHHLGHEYDAQPADLYRRFGDVTPRSDKRLSRGVWIGLVLAKAGPNVTEVEPV